MSERPIRVLVVDDSLTVRRHLVEVLSDDARFEVVGEAADGHAAIGLCDSLRPDVVTLDMVMPGLDGLAATEHIMAYFPTPILIVSASYNRGEVLSTYDALAAGAVDVIEKPRPRENGAAWAARFREQLRRVSRIKVITHPRLKLGGARVSAPREPVHARRPYTLVALGASTGGPSALAAIVRALPADFPLPVLVVLHIGEAFGPTFAEWLQTQTGLPVSQAVDGEPLPYGQPRVIVAPAEHHLELHAGRLRVQRGPERNACRPSVDVLFESIAASGEPAIACLLTGMGRDGAAGMLAIKQAGGMTLAQDEASCVVFGMPREAARLGAVQRMLPLAAIGPQLNALTRRAE